MSTPCNPSMSVPNHVAAHVPLPLQIHQRTGLPLHVTTRKLAILEALSLEYPAHVAQLPSPSWQNIYPRERQATQRTCEGTSEQQQVNVPALGDSPTNRYGAQVV